MFRRALISAGILVGVVVAIAAPSFGGQRLRTSGDSVLLVDHDGGTAMFDLQGMVVGVAHSRCTTVTNAGTRAVHARLSAHVDGRLRNSLVVRVTRGSLPPGTTFPGCGGFVPDASVQNGLGPGVLFVGTIGELTGRYANSTIDPGTWQPGVTRAYRLTVTLSNVPHRNRLATTASFIWKARAR